MAQDSARSMAAARLRSAEKKCHARGGGDSFSSTTIGVQPDSSTVRASSAAYHHLWSRRSALSAGGAAGLLRHAGGTVGAVGRGPAGNEAERGPEHAGERHHPRIAAREVEAHAARAWSHHLG